MAKPGIGATAARIARETLPAIMKPLRTLWNEVISFMFLALAALALPSAFRLYRALDDHPDNLFKLSLTVVFIVIMGGYGISSYLRARRISRS